MLQLNKYTYIVYMNYEAKDLPYNQFEKIGMSKQDVLSLPPDDLKALLTGRTTHLQSIKVNDKDVAQRMNVKLSMQRFADGSLNLLVHPIRNEIRNDDKLTNTQLETLKKGETLIAPKTSMNGEKELYLFQLDRETNEIIKTRLNSISVPMYLMDIELTPQDKSDLLQGKAIKMEDKFGKTHEVAVDLIDPKGYVLKNVDQKQEMSLAQKQNEEVKIPTGVKR